MTTVLSAIAIAVGAFLLGIASIVIAKVSQQGEEVTDALRGVGFLNFASLALLGAAAGTIFYYTPQLAGKRVILWLLFALIVVFIGAIVYQYLRYVECLGGFVTLVLLETVLFIPLRSVCSTLGDGKTFLGSVVPVLVLGVGLIIPLIDFLKEGDETSKKIGATVLVVAVLAIVSLWTFGVFNSPSGGDPDTDDHLRSEISDVSDEDQDALTVRLLTQDELDAMATSKYYGVSEKLLKSSLSTCDKERVEKAGCSDAVTMPFVDQSGGQKTVAELYEEILRNPIFCPGTVKGLETVEIGKSGKTLGSFNPWMSELVKMDNEGVIQDGHHYRHFSRWCWKREDDGNKGLRVTARYRRYAATLCNLLERFKCRGVFTLKSKESWCLNAAADDEDRTMIKSPYQENKKVLVFDYIGKNGQILMTIGFNLYDKRLELFDENSSEKATQQSKSGTGNSNSKGSEPTTKNVEPTTKPKPSPEPTTGSKKPAEDDVNKNGGKTGGGQDKKTDRSGDYQANDSRKETTTVKHPKTPPGRGDTADHEKKMDYTTDPVSDRGPSNGGSPNPSTGDGSNGEFAPGD